MIGWASSSTCPSTRRKGVLKLATEPEEQREQAAEDQEDAAANREDAAEEAEESAEDSE